MKGRSRNLFLNIQFSFIVLVTRQRDGGDRIMNTIVKENQIYFKELEQKIFTYICELGREITQIMLESYDKELAECRDKKAYHGKGSRTTTIKTVYEEVEYRWRVYRIKTEEGQTVHVFLLDE